MPPKEVTTTLSASTPGGSTTQTSTSSPGPTNGSDDNSDNELGSKPNVGAIVGGTRRNLDFNDNWI